MFSELPSIFDRNFVISFFLPALILISVSLGLLYGFGFSFPLPTADSPLQATTIIAALSLLGGIILLVLNYEIYRILEGYPVQSFKISTAIQRRRFKRLQKELQTLKEERGLYQPGDEMPPKLITWRPKLMMKAVRRFPDKEELVLPTSFGNIIRAFEVYSRVIYGFDAIPGWERLQAVIPKDYQGIISETKAITDFWVNMLVISCIFVLEYLVLVLYTGRPIKLWTLILFIGIAVLSYSRAKRAAINWGETVKGAFDVFLPDLRKKLEFPFPADIKQERELWIKFSRVMIYELKDIELTRERPPNAPPSP